MQLVPLTPAYPLVAFDCGDDDLNRFQLDDAKHAQELRIANTFILEAQHEHWRRQQFRQRCLSPSRRSGVGDERIGASPQVFFDILRQRIFFEENSNILGKLSYL